MSSLLLNLIPFNRPRPTQKENNKKIQGGDMRIEYVVLGVVAVLVVAGGIALFPDFVRYMKIRSM